MTETTNSKLRMQFSATTFAERIEDHRRKLEYAPFSQLTILSDDANDAYRDALANQRGRSGLGSEIISMTVLDGAFRAAAVVHMTVDEICSQTDSTPDSIYDEMLTIKAPVAAGKLFPQLLQVPLQATFKAAFFYSYALTLVTIPELLKLISSGVNSADAGFKLESDTFLKAVEVYATTDREYPFEWIMGTV